MLFSLLLFFRNKKSWNWRKKSLKFWRIFGQEIRNFFLQLDDFFCKEKLKKRKVRQVLFTSVLSSADLPSIWRIFRQKFQNPNAPKIHEMSFTFWLGNSSLHSIWRFLRQNIQSYILLSRIFRLISHSEMCRRGCVCITWSIA